MILVAEPYFNEAGFEKQKGSQQGRENSRMYNEMVVLKLVQSQTKLIQYPPPVFKQVVVQHFATHSKKLLSRLNLWMEISEQYNNQHPLSPVTPTTYKNIASIGELVTTTTATRTTERGEEIVENFFLTDNHILPEFPLIPASRGFCITLKNTLANFERILLREKIMEPPSSMTTAYGENDGGLTCETFQKLTSQSNCCLSDSADEGNTCATVNNKPSQEIVDCESLADFNHVRHQSQKKKDSLEHNNYS